MNNMNMPSFVFPFFFLSPHLPAPRNPNDSMPEYLIVAVLLHSVFLGDFVAVTPGVTF